MFSGDLDMDSTTHFVKESILSFMGSLYTKMPHPTEEWTGPLG